MTNFQKTAIFWASIIIVFAAVVFAGLRTVMHQVETLKNVKLPELKISDEELRTLKDSPFYKEVIDNNANGSSGETENADNSVLKSGLRGDTSLQ